jgi:hypothetical protein
MVGDMTYDITGRGGLDYLSCRYGRSQLQFRGPKRRLDRDHALFLGGTETYGRYIVQPMSDLVEAEIGHPCVNLGVPNAGVDAFLNDVTIKDMMSRAQVTVVQVMGAQNMSNRFYAVHPRRNDRFLNASDLMKRLFRDVDFTEYTFNRHMLLAIRLLSLERYQMIEHELREAWVARMRSLLQGTTGRKVLLWFARQSPDASGAARDDLGPDPLFITRDMIEALRHHVTEVVEVVVSPLAQAQGTTGMVFDPLETVSAGSMLGPAAHAEAAAALAPVLKEMFPAHRQG